MDFNTETGGSSTGPPNAPQESVTRGARSRSGNEFNFSDPVGSFVATVRSLATAPVAFFAGMARQGDFLGPLAFAIICAEVTAIIGGILGILGALVGLGNQGIGGAIGSFVGALFLTPIFAAIGLAIGAGILHLMVILLVKPVNSNFETTFRVISYSAMPQLIGWIPFLGPLIAGIASIVLSILGIREAHSTTTGKAALVVLIPAAVLILIALLLALIVGAVIFSMLNA